MRPVNIFNHSFYSVSYFKIKKACNKTSYDFITGREYSRGATCIGEMPTLLLYFNTQKERSRASTRLIGFHSQ